MRGKAKSKVEFGAKVSVSLVRGFSFVERIGWDAYNESCDLEAQIERYRERLGFYPESVHVDRLYRTRENRRFCREHGICLSGLPLGRPKTGGGEQTPRGAGQDERDRSAIEGKFGQGKRRFGLDRVMAKLKPTAETMVMVSFLVMNLEKILAGILSFLFFFAQYMLEGRLPVCKRLSRPLYPLLSVAA